MCVLNARAVIGREPQKVWRLGNGRRRCRCYGRLDFSAFIRHAINCVRTANYTFRLLAYTYIHRAPASSRFVDKKSDRFSGPSIFFPSLILRHFLLTLLGRHCHVVATVQIDVGELLSLLIFASADRVMGVISCFVKMWPSITKNYACALC